MQGIGGSFPLRKETGHKCSQPKRDTREQLFIPRATSHLDAEPTFIKAQKFGNTHLH